MEVGNIFWQTNDLKAKIRWPGFRRSTSGWMDPAAASRSHPADSISLTISLMKERIDFTVYRSAVRKWVGFSPKRWRSSRAEGREVEGSVLLLQGLEVGLEGEDVRVLVLELSFELLGGDLVGLEQAALLLDPGRQSRLGDQWRGGLELVREVGLLEDGDVLELGDHSLVRGLDGVGVVGELSHLELGIGNLDGGDAGEEVGEERFHRLFVLG